MKKKLALLSAALFSSLVFSQVGINTNTPNATLDINSKTTDGSKPEGLLIPRLTGDQIKAGDSQYNSAQTGDIIYATSAVSFPPSVRTFKMRSPGFYYFNGSQWDFLDTSIYKSDGSLTGNRTVTMGANNLVFNGTGNVGVGQMLAPTAKLDILGNIKITDGTQGTGKILTSDANGLATWSTPTPNVNIYNSDGNLTGNRTVTMGANNLVFDGSGNVGVGTATPTNRLHLKSTTDPLRIEGVQIGNSVTDNILAVNNNGTVKTIGTLDSALNSISVPSPAVFILKNSITNP